jgi:hypothetical protein
MLRVHDRRTATRAVDEETQAPHIADGDGDVPTPSRLPTDRRDDRDVVGVGSP